VRDNLTELNIRRNKVEIQMESLDSDTALSLGKR
jgi:hypothetical protein